MTSFYAQSISFYFEETSSKENDDLVVISLHINTTTIGLDFWNLEPIFLL